jgi:thiamine transporter ThiT
MKNHNKLLKMILAALFLALAYVMPFLTGQIPEVGSMLCPMHIPVILCGFICGPVWGLAVGIISPLLRSMILTMPPLFPMAVCMAFELAAYGAVAGLMHRLLPRKKPFVYVSLIVSMLVGRLVFGAAMFVCMGVKGMGYTFSAFIAGAFTEALPGIIVQLILIPIIVMIAENKNVLDLKD